MFRRSSVVLLAGLLVLPSLQLGAQGPTPAAAVARLEALNARLALIAADARTTPNAALDAELDSLADARVALLADLMESTPGEVLRLSLSPDVRASLPARLSGVIETPEDDLTGNVEVAYEDYRDGTSRLRHTLATATGRLSLHFATPPPAWTTGDRVRVRGVRLQNMLALNGDGGSVTTLAATPPAATSGEQRTLVILVNFQDRATQPYTAAYASSLVFGTTTDYLRETSAGRMWLSGDVVDWTTIPMSYTSCDTTTLANYARQAAVNAGIDLSLYARFMYAFPQNACSWWGLGSVGGNPSAAWINGDLQLEVAGHELGHNIGLHHSRSLDCGAASIGGSCTVNEYGDTLDLMGAARGHFNAFQKERIGWFDAGQVQTITTSGQYTIEPMSSPGAGVKALKILKSVDETTGRRTYYYVEARQGLGFDVFMANWTNVVTGVAIHTGTEATANSSYLLDMTPETSSWYDPALVAGRTFTDTSAGVSVSTAAVSSSGATVSVVVTPPACVRLAPTVTLSPGAPAAVNAGTTLSYTVNVTNNDSAGCLAAVFALTPAPPSGWSASLGSSSLALSPGASQSVALPVTSAASAAAGTYSVGVSVTGQADAAHTTTGAASYTVRTPLSLTVVTDKTSYLRSDTVTATARAMMGAVPASGVAVTIQTRKADGKLVTSTVTSDANGYAVYRLRLGRKDPLGMYQVTVTSPSASAATTSYTVR